MIVKTKCPHCGKIAFDNVNVKLAETSDGWKVEKIDVVDSLTEHDLKTMITTQITLEDFQFIHSGGLERLFSMRPEILEELKKGEMNRSII